MVGHDGDHRSESAGYSAFISYATPDQKSAERICFGLEERNLRCWIASRDARAGYDYGEEIVRGIENARTLIVLLSEEANRSRFVKAEVERAYSKGKPVLPVRLENVPPSPGLELFISTSHWTDAWRGDLKEAVDRLIATLEDRSATLPPSPKPRTVRRVRPILIGVGSLVAVGVAIGVAYWSLWPAQNAPGAATSPPTEPVDSPDPPARSAEPAPPESARSTGDTASQGNSTDSAVLPQADEPAADDPPQETQADVLAHRVQRNVEVRDSASGIASVIARLRAGDIVEVEAFDSSRWVKVHLDDGRIGFVPKDSTRPY